MKTTTTAGAAMEAYTADILWSAVRDGRQRAVTTGRVLAMAAGLMVAAGLSTTVDGLPGDGIVSTRSLGAQSVEAGRAGPRTPIDHDTEVALALSAAPPAVTKEATVLVWTGDGFETARRGSSGVTCYVARSWPDSLEPHCFDEVGSRTILPIHLRQMELWNEGRPPAEIDAEIAEGLRDGTFRLPQRPAMSYMMSAGQQLIDDDGQPAGRWQPHLMIYFPWLTEKDLGLGPMPSTEAAVVVDPGTPLSNIMIVVKDFVAVPKTLPPAGYE